MSTMYTLLLLISMALLQSQETETISEPLPTLTEDEVLEFEEEIKVPLYYHLDDPSVWFIKESTSEYLEVESDNFIVKNPSTGQTWKSVEDFRIRNG